METDITISNNILPFFLTFVFAVMPPNGTTNKEIRGLRLVVKCRHRNLHFKTLSPICFIFFVFAMMPLYNATNKEPDE